MLRITRRTAGGREVLLLLEGELRGPWVESLREACEPVVGRGCPLQLDLAEVTYLGHDGRELLLGLRARGVRLARCSPLVTEELRARPLS